MRKSLLTVKTSASDVCSIIKILAPKKLTVTTLNTRMLQICDESICKPLETILG